MVSPASFSDLVLGKLLVGLGYQPLLAGVVLVIQSGFVGQVPLAIGFAILRYRLWDIDILICF